MKHLLLPVALVLAPTALLAESYEAEDSEGVVWIVEADGKSATMTATDTEDDVWTLAADCTAFHPVMGDGIWGWANGGWAVLQDDVTIIGFPRQEAPFNAPDCQF
jgi:hypothetical protein